MSLLTKILKPLFSKITCHCVGSIGLGIIAATFIAFGIVTWGGPQDTSTVAATYTIRLPQDEEMLKNLSDAILEGTDVAGEAQKLTDIAPAAGSAVISAE